MQRIRREGIREKENVMYTCKKKHDPILYRIPSHKVTQPTEEITTSNITHVSDLNGKERLVVLLIVSRLLLLLLLERGKRIGARALTNQRSGLLSSVPMSKSQLSCITEGILPILAVCKELRQMCILAIIMRPARIGASVGVGWT